MSSFSGIIEEIPNVSVDRFDGPNLKNTAFFLSHCHWDHMRGLFDKGFLDRLLQNGYILYCSEISYQILMRMGRNIERYVNSISVLSVHLESIITVPMSDDYPVPQEVTVTLIPAGHCPGSVMFMFDGEMGKILYTGDIRIAKGDIGKLKQLQDRCGNAHSIEVLYLDTTFLNPSYGFFPPRKTSADELCALISEWINANSNHYVLIDTPAIHGSEYLYTEIFHKLKMKVHVPQDHFNLYQMVPEVLNAITASAALTQIHACLRFGNNMPINDGIGTDPLFIGYYKGSRKTPCSLIHHAPEGLVRTIKPSAQWYKSEEFEEGCISKKFGKNLFKVAYSSHSSFDELKEMISFLNVKKIHPCVHPAGISREDSSYADRLLESIVQKSRSSVSAKCSFSNNDIECDHVLPPRKKRVC